jgi:hypothetical protein
VLEVLRAVTCWVCPSLWTSGTEPCTGVIRQRGQEVGDKRRTAFVHIYNVSGSVALGIGFRSLPGYCAQRLVPLIVYASVVLDTVVLLLPQVSSLLLVKMSTFQMVGIWL